MMIFDDSRKVSLYNACFDDMRRDLDIAIGETIARMDKHGVVNGAITCKIEIGMARHKVEDDNSPTGEREALKPSAIYKINVVLQSKGGYTGDVIGSGYELVKGEDGNYYALTKEEASGQLSMFTSIEELPFAEPEDE